jgi:hypothetical protein
MNPPFHDELWENKYRAVLRGLIAEHQEEIKKLLALVK